MRGISQICLALLVFAATAFGHALSEALPPVHALATLKAVPVVALEGESHHVQGLETDGESFWVTSVDRGTKRGFLAKFEAKSGKRIAESEVQSGAMFHPGGLSLNGGVLWMPVAEYRREGPSRIESRHPDTLALISSFDCADHIGCVAADGERLIGGNWDCRKLYFWDRAGKLLEVKENPEPAAYQDMKLVEGVLIASGMIGKGKDRVGVIDWLNPTTLTRGRRITGGVTERGACFMQEGMALGDGRIFLLPEDGATRVFGFELPKR